MSKFTQNSTHCDDAPKLFIFLSFWPFITIVPVVIWAEACPIASSSTESLNTAGLKLFVVYTYLKKTEWGDERGEIEGRWCYRVMPPVLAQGPVCPDHVAASAWLPMSWTMQEKCSC